VTGTGTIEVAAIQCIDVQADLEPDLFALVTSVYLEDKPLFFLQARLVLSNVQFKHVPLLDLILSLVEN
jgi:hypothetical protein